MRSLCLIILLFNFSSCRNSLWNFENSNKSPEVTQRFIHNNFLCSKGSREYEDFQKLKDSIDGLHDLAKQVFSKKQVNLELQQELESDRVGNSERLKDQLRLFSYRNRIDQSDRRSYQNPLYFGPSDIRLEYEELQEIKSLALQWGDRWQYDDFLDFQNEWLRSYYDLKRRSERLFSQSCSLNRLSKNQPRDLRGPLDRLSSLCPELPWSESSIRMIKKEELRACSDQLVSLSDDDWISLATSLCVGLKRHERVCRHQVYGALSRRDSSSEIFQYYLLEYVDRIGKLFFDDESPNVDLFCKKKSNQYELRLPLWIDDRSMNILELKGMTFETLKKEIKSIWSSSEQGLELKITFDKNASLELAFHEDALSVFRYSHGRNEGIIYLDQRLSGERLIRVLAHEIGHALGFPDCYVESYDLEQDKIVYYELGQKEKNIMCSIREDSEVPPAYFSQLINRYCF